MRKIRKLAAERTKYAEQNASFAKVNGQMLWSPQAQTGAGMSQACSHWMFNAEC